MGVTLLLQRAYMHTFQELLTKNWLIENSSRNRRSKFWRFVTGFESFFDTGFGKWLCTFQKSWLWFDHLQTELEAHILCVSSTGEYYSHTKYELLTPSQCGRTRTWISENCKVILRNLYQEMVQILTPNAKISMTDFSKSFDPNKFWSKIPERTAYKLSRAAMLLP